MLKILGKILHTKRKISQEEQQAIELYEEILSREKLLESVSEYKDETDIAKLAHIVAEYDDFIAFLDNIEVTESFSTLLKSKVEKFSSGKYGIPDLGIETYLKNDLSEADKIIQKKIKSLRISIVNLSARLSFLEKCDSIPLVEINISDKESHRLASSLVSEIAFSNITKKTRLEKVGNFVVFDVETTGLSVVKNEIVEISAIRFRDFQPVEAFSTLCKPKKGICEEATEVNGITESMVEDKPTFGQIAESFLSFIGSDNLVGHNLEFDLKFIVKFGVDVMSSKRKYYDTLDIAKRTLKKISKKWDSEWECYVEDYDKDYDVFDYKLETLCGYYGIALSGAHRALADCMATGMLFEQLCLDRTE